MTQLKRKRAEIRILIGQTNMLETVLELFVVLTAFIADDGFLPRVDLLVPLQMRRLREPFIALSTAIGPLSAVSPRVRLQMH